MAGPSSDELQRILETWFDRLALGEKPDLGQLCGGDTGLEDRVRGRLDSEPEALRALSRAARPDELTPFGLARLGDFTILHPIGAGGMGRVFLARQESLGRPVALKVLDARIMADARARTRFRREAEIAASLDHPNIVPIYAVGEDSGFPFIAMKWLSGPPLDSLKKKPELLEVARLGELVARALAEAHAAGVIHRDIKPGNIILDGDQPVVVDFGLARAVNDVSLTQIDAAPGTLPYMPPEQLRKGGAVTDGRSDLYSLGATLYEFVQGRPPFGTESRENLMRAILLDEAPRLGLKGPARDLETIILRALAKDPGRRFQNAEEMAGDLGRFRRGEPILSRPVTWLERAARTIARHQRTAAAMALLVLTSGALLAVLLVRRAREESDIAEGLRRAGIFLDGGRLIEAGRELTRVERIAADVPGKGSLEGAGRRFFGGRGFLLDELLENHDPSTAGALQPLVDRVESTRAGLPNQDLARVAILIAGLQMGRAIPPSELALFPDEKVRGRRDVTMLRSVVRGNRAADLPPIENDIAPGETADEHVLAHLVAAAVQRPLPERRAEIERALLIDPSSFRARMSLAFQVSEEARGRRDLGSSLRHARDVFSVLVDDVRVRPAVFRGLARAQCELREPEAALRTIAAEKAAFPGHFVVGDASVELLACALADRQADVSRILADCEARGIADTPAILTFRVQRSILRASMSVDADALEAAKEQVAEARESAGKLMQSTGIQGIRDFGAGMAFAAEVMELKIEKCHFKGEPLSQHLLDRCAGIPEKGSQALETLTDSSARSFIFKSIFENENSFPGRGRDLQLLNRLVDAAIREFPGIMEFRQEGIRMFWRWLATRGALDPARIEADGRASDVFGIPRGMLAARLRDARESVQAIEELSKRYRGDSERSFLAWARGTSVVLARCDDDKPGCAKALGEFAPVAQYFGSSDGKKSPREAVFQALRRWCAE